MARYAAIDVGTNTVLLLVAEQTTSGFSPVAERSAITRLGKGVDANRRLAPEAMERTLEALGRFAAEARSLGAVDVVVSATSAARDAQNGAEFLAAARARAGVDVEILSGDEEARLSYLAVATDFAAEAAGRELVAIDIGGGSTEFIFGTEHSVRFHTSLNVGSVRLTERYLRSDPPAEEELARASRRARFGARCRAPSEGQRAGGGRRRHRHHPLRRSPRRGPVRRCTRAQGLALPRRAGTDARSPCGRAFGDTAHHPRAPTRARRRHHRRGFAFGTSSGPPRRGGYSGE